MASPRLPHPGLATIPRQDLALSSPLLPRLVDGMPAECPDSPGVHMGKATAPVVESRGSSLASLTLLAASPTPPPPHTGGC